LKPRLQEYPPSKVSEITGIAEETIERIAHEYAANSPAFIRVNYGLQRHAGGGMAVRNIFCLPALIGAWRYPGGGAVLSTSGFYKYNTAALERPGLDSSVAAHNQHEPTGRSAHHATPPVRATSFK
jgi:anaerobic selenocysteine-containing dehydrogenase